LLDLTFVVDSSGSINKDDPTNWDKSLEFVVDVVREFTIGPNDVQVAFVLFSTEATVEWGFGQYETEEDLTGAILGMRYLDGWTNLNDALYLTRTVVYAPGGGAREGALRATIILTDGEDNQPEPGTPLTIENATLCKEDGIWLIAVGVTDGVDEARLHEIISSPSDYYPVDDFDALPTIVDDLKSKICPEGPPPIQCKFYLIYIFMVLSERHVDHAFLSHLRYCHFLRICEKFHL